MTAKQYLLRYRDLDALITAKTEKMLVIRANAEKMTAALSGVSPSPGRTSDKVGRGAEKLADLEAEIAADIDREIALKHEIEGVIARIPNDRYRTLLTLVYIDGKTLLQASFAMHISHDWIKHIHGYALLEVKKYIELDSRFSETQHRTTPTNVL